MLIPGVKGGLSLNPACPVCPFTPVIISGKRKLGEQGEGKVKDIVDTHPSTECISELVPNCFSV